MRIIKEFKEFAMRGNVIDLAVGVIIGAAFGKVITSLVNDIIMPPVGKLMGDVNFADKFVALDAGHYKSLAEAKAAGAPVIGYGTFVNVMIDFLIVAFCIFMLVKGINSLKKKPAPTPETGPVSKDCPHCLMTIPIKATRCGHCCVELK
jgi:large conductance mechanosensitive channel